MALQYTLSDIFKYEDITREYCNSEGGFNLTIQNLIELAALEDEFNIDYAFYLRFKRMHQIEDYILQKAKKYGCIINVKESERIVEELLNNENKYEEQIEYYYNNSLYDETDVFYDIINQALFDKNWELVYYIYHKENNELFSLIAKTEDEFNEKKEFKIESFS